MLHSWHHMPSSLVRIQLSHVSMYASHHYVTTETAFCAFHFFTALFSWMTNNLQQDHCSFAVLLPCTDDDNRRYRNVCNMSFVSFAFATIFIIRLFSTSTFRVLNCYLFILLIDMLELCFMFNLLDYNFGCIL